MSRAIDGFPLLALSFGAAALTFGLQAMWLFLNPRIIIGAESIHATIIVVAALFWGWTVVMAWLRLGGWVGASALLGTPFALYTPFMIVGWYAACAFQGQCI